MEANGVVPDVIDAVPENIIKVKHENDFEVDSGNELTPLSVKDRPTSIEWPIEEGQFYTLIMIDPDAPCRKKPLFGPALHWLVMNIPGSDLSKGETLTEYVGAGAPEGTGLHRYVFLAYKQTQSLSHSEKHVDAESHDGRMRFNLKKFTQKYNLGKPIAGNFYQAQFDDYLKEKYAKRATASFRGRMENMFLNIFKRIYC